MGLRKFGLCGAVLALALMVTLQVQAQDEGNGNFVNPSSAQLELYQEGSKAFADGSYTKAVDHFQASLMVGELNITYLNLGRALFKDGKCFEAKEAYDKVPGAPQIREPSPVQVLGKLEEFRKDLESCPGRLVVTCSPANMTISIDGGKPVECDGKPVELPTGNHTVIGTVGDKSQERKITVKPVETAELKLKVEVPKEVVVPTPPPGGGDGGGGSLMATLGWVQLGVSAAALGAGVFFFFDTSNKFDSAEEIGLAGGNRAAFEDAKDDVETSQLLSNFFYGLSAVTLVSGALFVFVLDDSGDSDKPSAGGLKFGVSPTGVTVGGEF